MTRSWLRPSFALALLLCGAPNAYTQTVYVACSDDRRVRSFAIGEAGILQPIAERTLPGKPGAMALSADGQRIYAVTTGPKRIVTLKRGPSGALDVEASLDVDSRLTFLRAAPGGDHLLAASYGKGLLSLHAIRAGVCGPRLAQQATERTAHCATLDPSGRYVFVPHTVPNRIHVFRFDAAAGTLTPASVVAGPDTEHRYHGPRHLRFHPTLPLAYSSNELDGGISAWRFDAATGTLTLAQTLSSVPPDFEGKTTGAEVRITPNGRFAYVSNRDHGTQNRDTLAAFAIDEAGVLRSIGAVATASFPRAFAITVDGRYLYAAGQKDGQLAGYRIQDAGTLDPMPRIPVGARPSWVLCSKD